jgi:hypothetical protein
MQVVVGAAEEDVANPAAAIVLLGGGEVIGVERGLGEASIGTAGNARATCLSLYCTYSYLFSFEVPWMIADDHT